MREAERLIQLALPDVKLSIFPRYQGKYGFWLADENAKLEVLFDPWMAIAPLPAMRDTLPLLHAGRINGYNRRSQGPTQLGILLCERLEDRALWRLCRVVMEERSLLRRRGPAAEAKPPWSRTVVKRVEVAPVDLEQARRDEAMYLEFREFNEQVAMELFREALAGRSS
jgi:hypothetical protein